MLTLKKEIEVDAKEFLTRTTGTAFFFRIENVIGEKR
jgi:hypothetical protein